MTRPWDADINEAHLPLRAEGGLVDEVFAITREAAKSFGRLPDLRRPARRGLRDIFGDAPRPDERVSVARLLEAGAQGVVKHDDAGGIDMRGPVDPSGRPIPPHLLANPGIRIRRRRRDPMERLGSVFLREAVERGWHDKIARGVIITKWPEIVGEAVAAHVTVDGFDGTTLNLLSDSTAWATRLRLMSADIVAKIASVVGDGIVERVRIKGPQAPNWNHGPLRVKGRGPRDTYG